MQNHKDNLGAENVNKLFSEMNEHEQRVFIETNDLLSELLQTILFSFIYLFIFLFNKNC